MLIVRPSVLWVLQPFRSLPPPASWDGSRDTSIPGLGWIFLGTGEKGLAGGFLIPARGGALRPILPSDPWGWAALTETGRLWWPQGDWEFSRSLGPPLAPWPAQNLPYGLLRVGCWGR